MQPKLQQSFSPLATALVGIIVVVVKDKMWRKLLAGGNGFLGSIVAVVLQNRLVK